MKPVHKLLRDDWSEYPCESEKILCDPNDRFGRIECSTEDKDVTCKNCVRIMLTLSANSSYDLDAT